MKKFFRRLLIVLGVGAFLGLLYFSFDYGRLTAIKNDSSGVSSLVRLIDSLNSLPPTIIRDTVEIPADPVIKWKTKYIDSPVEYPEPTIREDSLSNDELTIFVKDSLQGILFDRMIGYRLKVPKTVTITETVTEKVPFPYPQNVYRPSEGVYLGAGIGGGSTFAYSLGVGYGFSNHRIGGEYLRFGETNNWMVKYSYLISIKK